MNPNYNIQNTLLKAGFTHEVFNRLCGTHKCVRSNRIAPLGGDITNTSMIQNHYFGGKNYWEFHIWGYAPHHIDPEAIYLVGEDFHNLVEADEDFMMVVADPDYQDYIKKFDPTTPIEIITITTPLHYNYMPKPSHQDNKLTKVGSGRCSLRDIRFPSLKRGKSTWKRFWKLFPEYDGCHTKREYYQKQLQKLKDERERDKLNELQAHL